VRELVDKGILFALCIPALTTLDGAALPAAVVLVAAACTCLSGIFGGRIRWAVPGAYLILALVVPAFSICVPLAVYDLFRSWNKVAWGMGAAGAAALLIRCVLAGEVVFCLNIALLGALACYLGWSSHQSNKLRVRYHDLSDSSREHSFTMEQRNRELADRRDYEVRLATLNERNRIAREIHDNVGHMLTSAILQVGALRVVNRDERLAVGLDDVNQTLSQAMDRIRSSVHDLRDESIDLRARVEEMTQRFTFCPVEVQISAEDLPPDAKLCMLAVIGEALTNTARHSNATRASVRVREFPGFYQLAVADNGTCAAAPKGDGMGLRNIEDRVNLLGGTFTVHTQSGFQIFVTIPKQEGEP